SGRPAEIRAFREGWMARARELADELALPHTVDVANDPFFGRVGQIMAVSQIQQSLKFELLIPYHAQAKPTACMSFNYHREHFGQVWGLQDSRDELAHTGCVAFGMDRLVVALFANHGPEVARWPVLTRRALALGPAGPRRPPACAAAASMPLDPRARRFLETLAAMNPPSALALSVEERRAGLAHLLSFFGAADEVAAVDQFEVPGPENALAVRAYTPRGSPIGEGLPGVPLFHCGRG